MKKLVIIFILITSDFIAFGQSIDKQFSKDKMIKDLEVFKGIRINTNSGIYKYRTKIQIDSIYNWADNKIEHISTYREFYNLISTLTDYEGSCHNNTLMSNKIWRNLYKENHGYFPFPIKWIKGRWLINFEKGEIPLGAQIIAINNIPIKNVIRSLYKYYSTDGQNISGKRVGIRTHFSRYFRLEYGLKDVFNVTYKRHGSDKKEIKIINSVSYVAYYKYFKSRYSKPTDQLYYTDLKKNQKYNYKRIDSLTATLTLSSFAIGGNEKSLEHLDFVRYLDSLFIKIKNQNIKNLIVDIRNNGGGTDPNELVLYEYLSNREFSENKSAWVRFQKIPYLRYIKTKVPRFLRFLGVIKYNKYFKKEFSIAKKDRFYQSKLSEDHKIRRPKKNAFKGAIYLLINPEVASAASNFGSLLASNNNVIIIGEETMGGYYGHNGHTPMSYVLPKSKITTRFSVVNLEQYVIEKPNQIYGRGIIPDYNISQTYEDFINNKDTQLNYTLNFINRK